MCKVGGIAPGTEKGLILDILIQQMQKLISDSLTEILLTWTHQSKGVLSWINVYIGTVDWSSEIVHCQ